jgi:hypothetical protein
MVAVRLRTLPGSLRNRRLSLLVGRRGAEVALSEEVAVEILIGILITARDVLSSSHRVSLGLFLSLAKVTS